MSNTNMILFVPNNDETISCFTSSMTQDDYVTETMVTWITSMVVSILCLAAFVKLFFFPKVPPRSTTKKKKKWCASCPRFLEEKLVPSLFLIFSYVYGVSGISQSQQGATGFDNDKKYSNYLTQYSHVIPLVSGLYAVLVGLDLLQIYSSSKLISRKAVWWLCFLLYHGFAITGAIRDTEMMGVINLRTLLRTLVSICGLMFLLVIYTIRGAISSKKCNRFHFMLKAASLFVFIIGFIYDSFFYSKCGSYQAYQDCFKECCLHLLRPTSSNNNPKNQKGILNVAAMLATLCWAWSENSFPSVQRRRRPILRPLNNEDGDTVASASGDDDSSVESSLLEEDNFNFLEKDIPLLGDIATIDPELGSPVENNECTSSCKEEDKSHDRQK